MFDIGIIGAMEIEIAGLISAMSERSSEEVSGIKFYTGTVFGKKIVVARCGVGKVFAALCAEAMILKYSPSLIVNTGVAGGILSGISTGDVVVADSLVQHDMDTSALGDPVGLVSGINKIYFETDKKAVEILYSSAAQMGLKVFSGRIATGDKFIAEREQKAKIAEKFGALACEMEGAAIAQVAFVNKTPFAVIRAISDSADEGSTMDYPTFLPIAAKNSLSLTLELINEY